VVPERTYFYFTADVTATVPDERDCTAGGCELEIRFFCLTPGPFIRWIYAGSRSEDFTGSSFSYTYEYNLGWPIPGCGRPVISHMASIYVRGPESSWIEQESYLLDYDNFPLMSFRRAVER